MTRQQALQEFTQCIINGEPYGDSPEAFEQWLEDKHVEVNDLKLKDPEANTKVNSKSHGEPK